MMNICSSLLTNERGRRSFGLKKAGFPSLKIHIFNGSNTIKIVLTAQFLRYLNS